MSKQLLFSSNLRGFPWFSLFLLKQHLQELTRINQAIVNGDFFQNSVLLGAAKKELIAPLENVIKAAEAKTTIFGKSRVAENLKATLKEINAPAETSKELENLSTFIESKTGPNLNSNHISQKKG